MGADLELDRLSSVQIPMTVKGDFDAKLNLGRRSGHVPSINVLPSVETENLLENDVF
jgi:hypothetical protein